MHFSVFERVGRVRGIEQRSLTFFQKWDEISSGMIDKEIIGRYSMAVDAKIETNHGRRLSLRFLRTVATDDDLLRVHPKRPVCLIQCPLLLS